MILRLLGQAFPDDNCIGQPSNSPVVCSVTYTLSMARDEQQEAM